MENVEEDVKEIEYWLMEDSPIVEECTCTTESIDLEKNKMKNKEIFRSARPFNSNLQSTK